MTNEQAIAILEEFKVIDDWTTVHLPPMEDAVDKAIEALRSKVLCALADRACPFQGKEYVWCLTCPHISKEDRALVKKAVEEPKTGTWKKISPAIICECSECGQMVMTGDIESYKFCHGCGARMKNGYE